jgi:hypothetical protein
LILPDGRLLGGYFAFQRLSLVLPMMMPLAPLMYAPGADLAGPPAYAWVADHRYLFSGWKKRTKTCRSGGCDV